MHAAPAIVETVEVDRRLPPPPASDAPRPRPVFARHASSLILWRSSAAGTEVLMGMRGAGHRFMPNRLVFPGGATEARDGVAPAGKEPQPEVLAMLGRNAGPRLARALVMAAARELQEETGLSLGTPPQLDAIGYLCRAVTPPSMHMRFNARFLTLPAEAAAGELADSRELEGLRYYQLDEALRLDLMMVTREVLQRLQDWLALTPEQRRTRTELPVFKKRSWLVE